ncbi:hypothetical protein G9A89_006817 [Geosiphon pyriformis]|nr:hypothetical protein G9A89_006817 [Geosiphon pyriformis]
MILITSTRAPSLITQRTFLPLKTLFRYYTTPSSITVTRQKRIARLTYQSRKRGILETDLLLSTFASLHLKNLTDTQLDEYDALLSIPDWDIYYLATGKKSVDQVEVISSGDLRFDGGIDQRVKISNDHAKKDETNQLKKEKTEYLEQWRKSEVLQMLKDHVQNCISPNGEKGEETKKIKGLRMPNLNL